MRSHFPLGYAILVGFISAVLGILYWGLAPAEGSGTAEPIDEAVVIEETGYDAGVDPRFVVDERELSPAEQLVAVAGREVKSPDDYVEFVVAMSEQPLVERVYRARYMRRFPDVESYKHQGGLAAFRSHYMRAVIATVGKDMLPVFGCALEMDQQHAMERMLVDDRAWARQIDRDVEKAIRSS